MMRVWRAPGGNRAQWNRSRHRVQRDRIASTLGERPTPRGSLAPPSAALGRPPAAAWTCTPPRSAQWPQPDSLAAQSVPPPPPAAAACRFHRAARPGQAAWSSGVPLHGWAASSAAWRHGPAAGRSRWGRLQRRRSRPRPCKRRRQRRPLHRRPWRLATACRPRRLQTSWTRHQSRCSPSRPTAPWCCRRDGVVCWHHQPPCGSHASTFSGMPLCPAITPNAGALHPEASLSVLCHLLQLSRPPSNPPISELARPELKLAGAS